MKTAALALGSLAFLAVPAWAQTTPDTMPANSWLEVPNTKMRALDPCPARNCSYSGVEGQSAVIDDWCGAALDTKRSRLICWGGGHAGYFGNELYAFDVPTLKWLRLTNPTDPPTAGSDTNWDGTPQSRHTYGGIAYIAHADRYFAFGGAGSTIGNSGFPPCTNVWTFDFATLPYGPANWRNQQATGFRPQGREGSIACYDPVTRKVWFGEGWNSSPWDRWGLFTYDFNVNAWTQENNLSEFNGANGCVDTKRGLLMIIGNGKVIAYDIRGATLGRQVWTTTGVNALPSLGYFPGVDYDPVADRIVCWADGPVYLLNPDTKVWTANNPPGAPAPGLNGTYDRWSYVPSVNAFVLVTHVDRNVYFYKLTAGAGGTPPPPAADSDGDGMPDAAETGFGFNPSNADQDANGVLDGQDDWDGDGVLNRNDPTPGSVPSGSSSGSGKGNEGCGATGLEGFLLALATALLKKKREAV